MAAILDFGSEQFSLFLSTKYSYTSYQVSSQNGPSVQEKFKIYFKDGGHGGQLEFWVETILAIFDLQVAPILPTMFRVNGPFSHCCLLYRALFN